MIGIIENIDDKQWQKLAADSPFTTFFQTKECYDFYKSLTFFDTFLYGVTEQNELKGLICGYIVSNGSNIKKHFSRRAIVHGGPLIANDISDEALTALLKKSKELLKDKAIYTEFRNNNDYAKYKNIFQDAGFEYHPYLNYMVETNVSTNEVFARLSESKRRQIKKAKDSGVEIIDTKNPKDISEFYEILSKLYKYKIKKPTFPREFFDKFINLPHAHLFVAKYNDQVISGMACVSIGKKALYEWLVCGENQKFNHIYPSVAITYFAIEYASNNGFEKFDFMGAGKPNEKYGVRDFKEKFGGELVDFGRFTCINNRVLYVIGKTVINLLKKI